MQLGEEYKQYIIKEYIYWTLVLNEKQIPYLGRSYAWLKSRLRHYGENMRLSELPKEALFELIYTIEPDVVLACNALGYKTDPYGQDFLLNTDYLANLHAHNHHMHVHFVPRHSGILYPEPDIGTNFVDKLWGANWSSAKQKILEPPKLKIICGSMANSIKNSKSRV
jgi:diadenosine tetraphosphate (Ap4A) HIT family hydrolase